MLLDAFRAGRRAALARVISIVEDERPGFRELLHELHPQLGRAHRIGITGPPGAGKSTLSAALVRHYRAAGERVGVVAVDPTSPFTGGALLGDRIRMNELSLDDGVFVRSMASRGSLGGLARTTGDVADIMAAFGLDRVLIETVGVGQSELDVAAAADATVVVLVPESGDAVQAMKAGLMEIADIFVINKADRPGADRLARDVAAMLHYRTRASDDAVPGAAAAAAAGTEPWDIPVLQTVATAGDGADEIARALERHRAWLRQSGELERRRAQRLRGRIHEEVTRRLRQRVWTEGGIDTLERALPDVLAGRLSPYEVAARIVPDLDVPDGRVD